MSFPRYSKYKASGVEWLGDIPQHWKIARLKSMCEFFGGGTPDREIHSYWGGSIPWVSPKDMKVELIDSTEECITEEGLHASAACLLAPGHLFLVVRSGILKHTIPVAINAVAVAVNQDIRGLRFDAARCDAKYFLRWVQGLNDRLLLMWSKQGATVESIEHEYLANSIVALPSLDEQRAISTFLDQETAKIDALVADQRRLIELLREKRQAVISHAVTKGLDPTAPMRSSGIEWLGSIPAHWDVQRARRLFRERDTRSESGDEELLTVSHITGVTPRSEKTVYMFEAESNEDYKVCERGDLVINTLWAWMGAMGITPLRGIVSPAYNVYEPCARLAPRYVGAFVQQAAFAQEVTRHSKGVWISRLRLYPAGFFEVCIPVPPIGEQNSIAAFVDEAIANIEDLVVHADRAISLLQERRSALISAAVTGQIDVRDAARSSLVESA